MVELKYMLEEGGFAPQYAHPNDAAMDLRTPKKIVLKPKGRITVSLKIRFFIEPGFYLAILPKSGLAKDYGVSIINTPGTIDSGYTGEVGVILINHGDKSLVLNTGDKVCQGILKEKIPVELKQVYEKPVTDRGDGGYGSTGR